MRNFALAVCVVFLIGCAHGRIDILDENGSVIGECSANFYLHWHGAKHSVNYILNICAQEHLAKGRGLSDESILRNDYSLPTPPCNKKWNKKTAKEQFEKEKVTEQEYGYILAAIEYDYWLKQQAAQQQLAQEIISKAEYRAILAKAKRAYKGH